MRKFHHIGIPTADQMPGEIYLPEFGMYVSGFEGNPYGVEWMRFDPDSPIPPLVQRVPHVAFEVDDLEAELVGQEGPRPGRRNLSGFLQPGARTVLRMGHRIRSPDI